MAQHAQLRIDTGLEVYFCDPQSPWQRGTNENTNGLLRQYFPRGTDLARHSADDLAAVAAALNTPAPQDARLERRPPRSSTSYLATPPPEPRRHRGPGSTRARLSPLRPALRASLRDDSRATSSPSSPRKPDPSVTRTRYVHRTDNCCEDRLSPG